MSRSPKVSDIQIGTELSVFRKLADKTQAQVADAVGVSVQQIGKYERGEDRISHFMYKSIIAFLKPERVLDLEEGQSGYVSPARFHALQLELQEVLQNFEACVDKLRKLIRK